MRRPAFLVVALLPVALLLGACANQPTGLEATPGIVLMGNTGASATGLNALSVISTDKTVLDHAYSLYTGKDCYTTRIEQGRTYCEEDEIEPTPQVFCYRTLGRVTCYDRPDPYRNREQRVDRNDHNTFSRNPSAQTR